MPIDRLFSSMWETNHHMKLMYQIFISIFKVYVFFMLLLSCYVKSVKIQPISEDLVSIAKTLIYKNEGSIVLIINK